MPRYDPRRHHRRSIRLKGYDYSQPGAYFVTMVARQREHIFGSMGEAFTTGNYSQDEQVPANASPHHPIGTQPGSLNAIIQNFKSISTRKINQARNTPGNKIWQRDYYERIIRNDQELNAIRQYIRENPFNWPQDQEYR